MDGFFVFGFALTMTPVAGPSPPFRFSTSLIFGRSARGPFEPTCPMILGPARLGKVLSIAPHGEVTGDPRTTVRGGRSELSALWLTLAKRLARQKAKDPAFTGSLLANAATPNQAASGFASCCNVASKRPLSGTSASLANLAPIS